MSDSILRVYPDPILRRQSESVSVFDENLTGFVERLKDFMIEYDGVGLAAPQIGENIRVAVIFYEENLYVLINPEIKEADGEQIGQEGCLSFPGIFEDIARPSRVVVDAQDEKGNKYRIEATDFLARAMCHEIDHLNGKLMIDYLSPMKREMIKKKLIKSKKEDRAIE